MNDENVIITKAEHKRLKDCEKAWSMVIDALLEGNPDFLAQKGLTGIECARIEIERLQAVREG